MPNSKTKKRNIKVILAGCASVDVSAITGCSPDFVTFLRLENASSIFKTIAADDIAMVVVSADELALSCAEGLKQMRRFQHRNAPLVYLRKPETAWELLKTTRHPDSTPACVQNPDDLLQIWKVLDQGSRNYLNAHRIENSGYDDVQAYEDYKEIVEACKTQMKDAMSRVMDMFERKNMAKTKHWIHKLRNGTTYLSADRADKSVERLEKKLNEITPEKLVNLSAEIGAAIESAELFLYGMEIAMQGT